MHNENPRSVVVTGCGAGIGRSVLERLVADGWRVVGIDLDSEAARETAEILEGEVDIVVGDVTWLGTFAEAVRRAQRLAPLGGWVNNAGIVLRGLLHKATRAEVDRLFEVDLHAVFWGCAEAVRTFVEQRTAGSIVNVSSILGRASFPGTPAYDSAKGGVDALTRYVAVEYGPVGIRANAVAPGTVRTPLTERGTEEWDDRELAEREFARMQPLGRIAEPAEIAAVAAFLLSDEASFLSGQSIAVDGGATARCFAYDPDPGLLAHYKLNPTPAT